MTTLPSDPNVLALLAEGFEELEFIAPLDILRRAGATVTIAALADTTRVTGRSGVALSADTTLSDWLDAATGEPPLSAKIFSLGSRANGLGAYDTQPLRPADMLLLPGGPGVKLLRADPRVAALVKAHAAAKRWLAAICAAPTVLNDAGLLAGRRHTCHTSVLDELPAALKDERVVVDGNIITSRGAGTAIDFGLTLVGKLISPEKAREIHAAIAA